MSDSRNESSFKSARRQSVVSGTVSIDLMSSKEPIYLKKRFLKSINMHLENFDNVMLPNVILDSVTIIIDLIASLEPINFQKRVVESINYRRISR